MIPYFSISTKTGISTGVKGYIYDSSSITVYFRTGGIYHYTYNSCGSSHIETMKSLADSQSGLNTYVTTNKPMYAWKL